MFKTRDEYAARVEEKMRRTLYDEVDRELSQYLESQLWQSVIEKNWSSLATRHAWADVLDFGPTGELS